MSTLAIAIGATSLSLVLVFVWMFSLSLRKKRMEEERIAREAAYRRAMEKARQQERQDRIFKAETGHVPTILYLAKEAERNKPNEALYWYHKGALLDNITAMYGIVRLSDKKREDLVLREQANYWRLCIAGAEGDIHAKFEAAKALIYGKGVERNIPQGVAKVQEVAEEGNLEGILFMGDWNISPDNPTPSPKQSTEWFEIAADKQSEEGMTKLGLNYLNGVGVEQDIQRACYWLERAAEKGNVEAMYFAGEAWREVKPNGASIAYIWLFMSAYMGYEPAKSARDTVGSTLGVDSVVGLQSLAKPVLKKLQFGPVVKHSLIRALNKLYKRELPLFGLTIDKAASKEEVEQPIPSNEVSEQEQPQPDTDDSSAQYSYSSYGTNYTA
ncbi:sel1 repeat family protein [Vibrio sp. SCSIO 43140]|uniref:tetratricopeptide repeat protein n=1 Tax=Vibrio sp. SCSIO 43140 TaxID=2819100 RepID=UPI002076150D|nr:tetratricopeptide repeat protein [Vibrio sp. SCSIO 43140]USD62885.1 sel1 repeat family protein [Vibrio sp. SCSIO 43140]